MTEQVVRIILLLMVVGILLLGGVNFFLIKFNREVERQKAMLTLEDTIYLLRGKVEIYQIDADGKNILTRTRYLIELFPEWLYDPKAMTKGIKHNELTHWLLYGVQLFQRRYMRKNGEIRVKKLINHIHERTTIKENEHIRVTFSKEDNEVDDTYLNEFIPLIEKIIVGNEWREKYQNEQKE